MQIQFSKVNELPEVLDPDTVYMVKGTKGTVKTYCSDKTGSSALLVGYECYHQPSIKGPLFIETDSKHIYEISDYDSFTDYDIEAVGGEITKIDNALVYTAPSEPCLAGFIINGRRIRIRVIEKVAKARFTKLLAYRNDPVSYYTLSDIKRYTK